MNNVLETVYVSIEDLKPAKYNPRSWDKKAVSGLMESIKRFGFAEAIVCNSAPKRKNVVIGGHFRLHVAKLLGYKKVPVVYIELNDIEKEKELNLRLNKNTGKWDLNILKNFNLDLLLETGFNSAELKPIWAELNGLENDVIEKSEAVAEEPKTKFGQLYRLGMNRLLCGDSTDPGMIDYLMGDERANMVYSDMPYNIGLDYDKGLSKKSKYGGKTDDSKSLETYKNFVMKTVENGANHSKKDAHVFWWCDESYIWLVQTTFIDLGISNKRVCLWIKNNQNPTPGIAFNKCYEPCVYGTLGKPALNAINNLTEIFGKEITTGNDAFAEMTDTLNTWATKRIAGQDYSHPTEKPVTLHEKPLRRCSKPNDIVLDLFGGSGSTLIACEQLKRRCYMSEIEPAFCDVILKRYESLTGQKPVLIGTYNGKE